MGLFSKPPTYFGEPISDVVEMWKREEKSWSVKKDQEEVPIKDNEDYSKSKIRKYIIDVDE